MNLRAERTSLRAQLALVATDQPQAQRGVLTRRSDESDVSTSRRIDAVVIFAEAAVELFEMSLVERE